ncbi:hypothetical protein FQZ99_25790, partial [Escherichia coli]|nr:hypothetical protein [Escherichia coli]
KKLTRQLHCEHNLSTHPLYDLWGIWRRRANKILLSAGQLTFIHHGVSVQLPIGDIKNVKINKKWLYSEIVIGLESKIDQLNGFN